MPEVRRKKIETFEAMLRRFNRRLQLSGKLLQAKKVRFKQPKENKREVRQKALKREIFRQKLDYLLRAGKIREEDLLERRRQRGRRRR